MTARKLVVGSVITVVAFVLASVAVMVFQTWCRPSAGTPSHESASLQPQKENTAAALRGDGTSDTAGPRNVRAPASVRSKSDLLPSMSGIRQILRSSNPPLRLTPEQRVRVVEIDTAFRHRAREATVKDVAEPGRASQSERQGPPRDSQTRGPTDGPGDTGMQHLETLAALDRHYREALRSVLSETQMQVLDQDMDPEEHSGGTDAGPRAASPLE